MSTEAENWERFQNDPEYCAAIRLVAGNVIEAIERADSKSHDLQTQYEARQWEVIQVLVKMGTWPDPDSQPRSLLVTLPTIPTADESRWFVDRFLEAARDPHGPCEYCQERERVTFMIRDRKAACQECCDRISADFPA